MIEGSILKHCSMSHKTKRKKVKKEKPTKNGDNYRLNSVDSINFPTPPSNLPGCSTKVEKSTP